MSDCIFVGTRKGLFTVRRSDRGWQISDRQFLGDPVNLVFSDAHGSGIYEFQRLRKLGKVV